MTRISRSTSGTGCCEIFVAFVTQQTGRPSYCCYTREETITAGNSRHQMQMTVKLGAMNDGTITAILVNSGDAVEEDDVIMKIAKQ